MRVEEADQILERLPELERGLAVQMRVIEAILVSHRPELPPAEVDARMGRAWTAIRSGRKFNANARQLLGDRG